MTKSLSKFQNRTVRSHCHQHLTSKISEFKLNTFESSLTSEIPDTPYPSRAGNITSTLINNTGTSTKIHNTHQNYHLLRDPPKLSIQKIHARTPHKKINK